MNNNDIVHGQDKTPDILCNKVNFSKATYMHLCHYC